MLPRARDRPGPVTPRSQPRIPGLEFVPRVCEIRELLQPRELQEAVRIQGILLALSPSPEVTQNSLRSDLVLSKRRVLGWPQPLIPVNAQGMQSQEFLPGRALRRWNRFPEKCGCHRDPLGCFWVWGFCFWIHFKGIWTRCRRGLMWCSLLSGDGIIDILGSPVPWAHPRNSLGSSAEFPGLERSQEPSCSHRTF